MFTPPPRVFGPSGLELRDVMERGVVAFVVPGHPDDDVASVRVDLSEAVVLTATERACPVVDSDAPSAMPQEEHAVANSTADKTAMDDLITEG